MQVFHDARKNYQNKKHNKCQTTPNTSNKDTSQHHFNCNVETQVQCEVGTQTQLFKLAQVRNLAQKSHGTQNATHYAQTAHASH